MSKKRSQITVSLACKAHPRYKAKRPPRADCWACKKMYRFRHNGGPQFMRFAFRG